MTCVIDRKNIPDFEINHSHIKPNGFVADYTTCVFETKSKDEAHYLCALLNSRIVHQSVKSFQPRGKYGKRDIGRRPLQLTIPRFSGKEKNHRRLMQLSKQCHQKITNHTFIRKGFRGMRMEASKLLKTEIDKIDSIVSTIL